VLDGQGGLRVVDVADVGEDRILVHDAHRPDPSLAFALSRLSHTPTGPTPIGLFRQVTRPTYDSLMAEQLEDAVARKGEGDLATLIAGSDTWTVDG
jgi:2-oxoglutarate/2-oxoacid ferredoxin oxidoreductase subunit beta